MTVDDATPAARMAQCSITGKMVPEDELVTIQGHRVCAEGKAILLDRLKSGEALPGEKVKPRLIRRFGCLIVDGIILMVIYFVVSMLVGAVLGGTIAAGVRPGPTLGILIAAVVSILMTTIQIVYFGQMHGTRGQTIGKKAGKLEVVNRDGTPITLKTGYIRAFAYTGPSYVSGLAMLVAASVPQLAILSLLGSLFVGIWGLVDILLALFDRSQQRSLHDRIAGTRVVEMEA